MSGTQEATAAMTRLMAVVGQWYRYCPWAREQTFLSLSPYVLEEAREVTDVLRECAALPAGVPMPTKLTEALVEEVGDLLLQVAQLCELGQQAGCFSMTEVIEHAASKVLRRNPHVFGAARAETVEAVNRLWQQAKREERQGASRCWSDQESRRFLKWNTAASAGTRQAAVEAWLQSHLRQARARPHAPCWPRHWPLARASAPSIGPRPRSAFRVSGAALVREAGGIWSWVWEHRPPRLSRATRRSLALAKTRQDNWATVRACSELEQVQNALR